LFLLSISLIVSVQFRESTGLIAMCVFEYQFCYRCIL